MPRERRHKLQRQICSTTHTIFPNWHARYVPRARRRQHSESFSTLPLNSLERRIATFTNRALPSIDFSFLIVVLRRRLKNPVARHSHTLANVQIKSWKTNDWNDQDEVRYISFPVDVDHWTRLELHRANPAIRNFSLPSDSYTEHALTNHTESKRICLVARAERKMTQWKIPLRFLGNF